MRPRTFLTIEKAPSNKPNIDTRSIKEHLENIRAVLNPPIADLATLFNVSRQAIYKWLAETSNPEPEKAESIKTLSEIADTFKRSEIIRINALLHMKNHEGNSLFDLLKNKKPFKEQIKLLINEARAIETSYQKSGIAQSTTKPTNDWMSISIPSYLE
jgi:transcriptional regulator with XRE-family HTH domain